MKIEYSTLVISEIWNSDCHWFNTHIMDHGGNYVAVLSVMNKLIRRKFQQSIFDNDSRTWKWRLWLVWHTSAGNKVVIVFSSCLSNETW